MMYCRSTVFASVFLAVSVSATINFRSIYDTKPDVPQDDVSAVYLDVNYSHNHSASGLSPIVTYGNKFFDSVTGDQFFIKGIAYQPSRIAGDEHFADLDGSKFIDPMAEPKICLRDLPYLLRLGVNTVRIYSIDPEKDHDECFKAFENAGIYVFADLSEPDVSIVRESPTWDTVIYDRYTKVIDALHKYPNVLGFFAGNEVTNDKTNTDASPFVKSSIRDTKKYIKTKGYRSIPVGYSTNDDADTRNSLADYFACGEEFADFYGINMYEWCGYSTFYASGYRDRTEEFKNYPVPVFFSEFGCNVKRPRPFTEVEALYSRLMTDVWSGGIAYMYFEEPNQYGVVQLVNGKVKELDDFDSLKDQFDRVTPKGTTLEEYKKSLIIQNSRSCPPKSIVWEASSVIPQEPDSRKCDCMESTLECQLSPYVKENELKPIFEYACGVIDCEAIKSDGKKGTYGDFSDCSAKQKASYVINEVFQYQGGHKKNCDFNKMAALNSKVVSTQELSSSITNSGQTCAEVINVHNLKKQSYLHNKLKNITDSTSHKTASPDGQSYKYANSASKLNFYNNILKTFGLLSHYYMNLLFFYNEVLR